MIEYSKINCGSQPVPLPSRGMWAIICEKSAIDGAAVQEVVG